VLWNQEVHTDKEVMANWPDIIIINKKNITSILIDVTIPAERNVTQKGEEKKLIQQFMYRYKTNVKYQMYNYTCNKLSHWNSNKILKKLDPVPGKHLIDLAMLGTSQIIRQVLQSEALSLSGGEHGWFKRRTEE
jgi:hypothetical protein